MEPRFVFVHAHGGFVRGRSRATAARALWTLAVCRGGVCGRGVAVRHRRVQHRAERRGSHHATVRKEPVRLTWSERARSTRSVHYVLVLEAERFPVSDRGFGRISEVYIGDRTSVLGFCKELFILAC